MLFIIADKARALELGGNMQKGCRCSGRLKSERMSICQCRRLAHTRWSGGRGYLRREKWIGGERIVRARGECVCVKL